jgi:two-component SAPR family response regulator
LAEASPGKREVDDLRGCITLYEGQLLEGETAEWAIVERERLERLYLRLLVLLGNRLVRMDRLEEAIVVANRILAVDPFREATHRDLIITLALNEQRGAAIRHFERLRRLLRDELDLTPARETAALIDALRSEGFREQLTPFQGRCFSAIEATSTF